MFPVIVLLKPCLIPSWAEDHFIVAASVATVDMVRVIRGEGISIRAGVREGFSSRGGNIASPIVVIATISRVACKGVWRLAEGGQVRNRASGAPTCQTIGSLSIHKRSNVDLQRQIVGVHIAQVIRILAIAGADGELSKICFRLGIVSHSCIRIVLWESPN